MAAADFLQAERILRIDSALGPDQLLAQKLHWREAISELFEGRVSLRSKSPDLTPQDLLGKPVDLRLELGWGGQVIPRIGMEVMVSYLDGDPDRPVVTGVVPNARQKVPYDLPANKTRSTFRTNSHKGRGSSRLLKDSGLDVPRRI